MLLDSANWVVFQPNIVIDAKLGCLWTLELKLAPILCLMPDKIRLVEFLLQRSSGKKYMIQMLQSTILSAESPDLALIANIFDKLNDNYKSFVNVEVQSQVTFFLITIIIDVFTFSTDLNGQNFTFKESLKNCGFPR